MSSIRTPGPAYPTVRPLLATLACALLVVENYEALYTDQRKKEAAGLIAAVVGLPITV